jgi:hypothetical protein
MNKGFQMKKKIFKWLIVFLFLLCSSGAWGADTKITGLAADTAPTTDDLLVTVNDPVGTPANKKVTLGNLSKGLVGIDEAYNITNWNADVGLAEKDDLRDYFALFDTDGDGDVDNIQASVLIDGGTDPIDGDKLEITWSPSTITPDTGIAQADSVDDLAAILEGFEDYIDGLGSIYEAVVTEGSLTDSVIIAADIKDGVITEADLKVVDSAGDEQIFTSESTTGDFEWHTFDEVVVNMSEGLLPDASVVEADLKAVDAAADEDVFTYESTTGDFEWHTLVQLLETISATQGTVLYRGASAWAALGVGVAGQYLQTQGAAADPQWATAGVSGDIEDVGDASSGAAFTADGTGTTLYFEGATPNAFEAILTSVDVTADVTVTIPEITGTLVLGPAAFGTDNRLIKTNSTGNLMQITGVTVDDSQNITGVVALTMTGVLTTGSGAVAITDATGNVVS